MASMRPPRGSSQSRKYIVEVASASETGSTKIDFVLAKGQDNTTLGQASSVDSLVPVGSKIKVLDLRICYANLANVAVFVHWCIQRVQTGQSTIDPKVAGGSTLSKNIMLSGMKSVGLNQNSDMHIRYKVPKSMLRMADDMKWVYTSNATNVMTAQKEVVYKVFV